MNLPKLPLPSEHPTFHYIMVGLSHIGLNPDVRMTIRDRLLEAMPKGNKEFFEVMKDVGQYQGISRCTFDTFCAGYGHRVTIDAEGKELVIMYNTLSDDFPYEPHHLLQFVEKKKQ